MPKQPITVTCPQCKEVFSIDEVLTHQLEERLRQEYGAEAKQKLLEIAEKEKALLKKEQELSETEKLVTQKVQESLVAERQKIQNEAKMEAAKGFAQELKMLNEENARKEEALREARNQELEIRKEKALLDDEKKSLMLEVQRRLDAERETVAEQTTLRVSEEFRMKDLEKERQMNGLRKTIEELKRKSEQGSQQLQGEVQELDLEIYLKTQFPSDEIIPVPKGTSGADIIQKVRNKVGSYCGTILWESKRTKAWSDAWLTKLKEDQHALKSDLAVIVSTVLPQDIQNFGHKDNIWITNPASLLGLMNVLRIQLITVAYASFNSEHKSETKDALYDYVTGIEFHQRVEAMLFAYRDLKQGMEKEKAIMIRQWATREKEIQKILNSTAGMYGDLQGITMQALPEQKYLELSEPEQTIEKENEQLAITQE